MKFPFNYTVQGTPDEFRLVITRYHWRNILIFVPCTSGFIYLIVTSIRLAGQTLGSGILILVSSIAAFFSMMFLDGALTRRMLYVNRSEIAFRYSILGIPRRKKSFSLKQVISFGAANFGHTGLSVMRIEVESEPGTEWLVLADGVSPEEVNIFRTELRAKGFLIPKMG